MQDLLGKIEQARQGMYQLAERFGLSDPQVIEQSQRLDDLLNQYSKESDFNGDSKYQSHA